MHKQSVRCCPTVTLAWSYCYQEFRSVTPIVISLTCSVDGFLWSRPASSLALSVFISTTMSLFTSPLALDGETEWKNLSLKFRDETSDLSV